MRRQSCVNILVAAVLGGLSAAAQADGAAVPATPADQSGGMQLKEVIVTATKRAENLRDVAASISVLSPSAIQDLHIESFADISRAVPNVSFTTNGGGPGLDTLEIRGISSQAGTAAIGVYLDDTSLTTRNLYTEGTAEPRMFDVQRVEVLRGPQGTIWGGGTLGGVIRFVGNAPDLHRFSAYTYAEGSRTSYADGTNWSGQGVVNIPIVDGKLALRLGVYEGDDSGYVNQTSPVDGHMIARGINGNHWTVAKATLKWQVADGWSITPFVLYQKVSASDLDMAYLNLPLFQIQNPLREPGTDIMDISSLKVSGDVGIGTLTAVGSYFHRMFSRIQDGSYSNPPGIGPAANQDFGNAVLGLTSPIFLSTDQRQGSVELRLTSKPYDPGARIPATWLIGYYVSNDVTNTNDYETIPGLNALAGQYGVNLYDPNQVAATFPGAFANDAIYQSTRHYAPSEKALFGEFSYYFMPSLQGTAGLRYEKSSESFRRVGSYYFTGCDLACPTIVSPPRAYFHALTPRVALEWKASSGVSYYVVASKGYRMGSFNRPVPLIPEVLRDLNTLKLCNGTVQGCNGTIPAAFSPDYLWNYEAGTKSLFFDRRMALDASVFYMMWNHIQQDIALPTAPFDFETNVGHAKSYGVELDSRGRVTENLTLSLSLGYTHAAFSEDVPADGFAPDGSLNVRKGDLVPGVPEYSATVGAEYARPLTGNVIGFVRAHAELTGSSHGTLLRNTPDYYRSAYWTSGLTTGATIGNLEVSLFVKNLNNNQTVLQRPNVDAFYEGYYLRPRTIGGSVQYKFGGE